MKRIVLLLLATVIIVATAFLIIERKQWIDLDEIEKLTKESFPKIKSDQKKKEILPLLDGDLFDYIGQDSNQLKEQLGEPERKDMSAYGYTWWVYTDGVSQYVQFGVDDEEVVTVFAAGDDVSTDPLAIGTSYESIDDEFEFKDEVVYHDGLSFYKFQLDDDNLERNPLIKMSDELFAQLYFDTFTNELSSIRLLTGDQLLAQRIYEMEYRGSLPDKLTFDEDEWNQIEEGMEAQIFDLTNVYRNRFDVDQLSLDEETQDVAYLHSKDMEENNYFSHYAEDDSGLKERLEDKNIYYLSAGENIAAQHTDGPAAMEGWLNSEGHREALLNQEYTHLGVGVYHLYYTQNFLYKP